MSCSEAANPHSCCEGEEPGQDGGSALEKERAEPKAGASLPSCPTTDLIVIWDFIIT